LYYKVISEEEMTGRKKEEIITFKADPTLAEELNRLPNKSDFIRRALLRALGNECPLCNGAGTLTQDQMRHWKVFLHHHRVTKCSTCNEIHLICDAYLNKEH
jgi:hypothetical protein